MNIFISIDTYYLLRILEASARTNLQMTGVGTNLLDEKYRGDVTALRRRRKHVEQSIQDCRLLLLQETERDNKTRTYKIYTWFAQRGVRGESRSHT